MNRVENFYGRFVGSDKEGSGANSFIVFFDQY